MDENQAWAVLFANLGQDHKEKDLLATADAVALLRNIHGSAAKIAQLSGYSRDTVRQFYNLSRFSPRILKLFADSRLRLDQSDSLWKLNLRRPSVLSDASEAAVELTAHETRALVDYLTSHTDSSVDEAANAIRSARTVKEREYHIIALLQEDDFALLSVAAKRRKWSLDRLVTQIVSQWLSHEE